MPFNQKVVYIARDKEGRGGGCGGGWGGRASPLSPPVVIVGLCYPSIPQAPTVTTATLPQMYCKGHQITSEIEIQKRN